MISRRDVIRNLVVTVGGSSLLSACGGQVMLEALAPSVGPRFYGEREMALLSRVSDLLLPRTETPGALDVHVPALLDGLMAEWASAETQAAHRASLEALDVALARHAGGDFLTVPDSTAERALTALDADAFGGDPVEGYREFKALVTQAYFATEGGAIDEQGWVAVPGRWDPCVDR